MSVTNWTPAQPNDDIDLKLLEKGLSASHENQLERLPELLSESDQSRLAGQLGLPVSLWRDAMENLDNRDLKAAVRFFVRAEMLIPGCECGDKSPAIIANRLLKQRGERLAPEDLRWIRDNTTNRFIPNGAL